MSHLASSLVRLELWYREDLRRNDARVESSVAAHSFKMKGAAQPERLRPLSSVLKGFTAIWRLAPVVGKSKPFIVIVCSS